MKETIIMSCGHEETVEVFGPGKEREKKLKGYELYGLCKECYQKKRAAELQAEGLVFNGSTLSKIDDNGEFIIEIWFSGDTKPYKDEIKSLGGYWWGESDIWDDPRCRYMVCWHKTIKPNELQAEIDKAVSIGVRNTITQESLYSGLDYEDAVYKQQKWRERQKKIDVIAKPHVPEVLQGHTWNQKVYGKAGNYSIYPDGEKTLITDEQAEEIKTYLSLKEEYKRKIDEINV